VLLAVADWRTAWTVVGFSSSSLRFFFFCSVLLCFSFFSVSSSVSHGAGAVINDGEDGGSWRWLWGGAGGGYADSSRWFFLLSLLFCFHFQDLAMALVVLLLLFLSV
jgi:hypothetical protein